MTAKSSRCDLFRYGYGFTGFVLCTSKWTCGCVPFATPESPTYPITCPAFTFWPFFNPGAYAVPATHLPVLSFLFVRSLFRWRYSKVRPLTPERTIMQPASLYLL